MSIEESLYDQASRPTPSLPSLLLLFPWPNF